MNLETNVLMIAVFFAPMALLVLGNLMDLASSGYQAMSNSLPTPRPATIAPRIAFEAANDAHLRAAA